MVQEEITKEIRKFLELKENVNTTYQNLQYAAKAVLKGKFVTLNAYILKKKKLKINNLSFYPKKQRKESK